MLESLEMLNGECSAPHQILQHDQGSSRSVTACGGTSLEAAQTSMGEGHLTVRYQDEIRDQSICWWSRPWVLSAWPPVDGATVPHLDFTQSIAFTMDYFIHQDVG